MRSIWLLVWHTKPIPEIYCKIEAVFSSRKKLEKYIETNKIQLVSYEIEGYSIQSLSIR